MSKVIGVMGESGSGKTTSLRNLDPTTTFYIDCDKKGLSWKGWRKQYNAENGNYYKTDDKNEVMRSLAWLNCDNGTYAAYQKILGKNATVLTEDMKAKAHSFKTVVIDTLNGIMVADEVERMKEKGYDKWVDLAQCVWDLLNYINTMRDDLTVIILCHSQTQKEDDGYTFTRIKTSGKKLDKLNVESKLTTVLYATANGGEYKFQTHADHSTAKTPMGAIEENSIPNDIMLVIKALEDY